MADKTIRLGVDSSEAKNLQSSLRQSSEQLARDMIRSSRQYSTSSKEVVKDIEDQIRAIEKRNKLDAEFRRARLESLRGTKGFSESQYTSKKAELASESRQDQLQTKLLRELIETVKNTSKEEVREDRRNVERTIQQSKTVDRLGIEGDEFERLKETVQKGILGEVGTQEAEQRAGFNMSRYAGTAKGVGGRLMGGDVVGAAAMGGRGLISAAGGMSGGAIAATGIGAVILAAIAAALKGEDLILSEARDYAVATQTRGLEPMTAARRRFEGRGFTEMDMGIHEAMNFYAGMNRAAGGSLSEDITPTLAAITRSRDISPDLLKQTVGFQRYSNTGGAPEIVSSFEQALRRIYPEEFQRKLVQLPEMMGVYNSLAQQMVQTTGVVNAEALSGFVGGVREGFGVEGVNLQRYAGGLMQGFRGSNNNFTRKMQFASMRQAYGDISYQETLERLERPYEYEDYMRSMYGNMKRLGLPAFRSWVRKDMNLGAKEAGEMFRSDKEFEQTLQSMGTKGNKTVPSQAELMNNYIKEAKDFYGKAETFEKEIKEFFTSILIKFSNLTISENVTEGIENSRKGWGMPWDSFDKDKK